MAFDARVFSLQFIACYSRQYIMESSGTFVVLKSIIHGSQSFFLKHLSCVVVQGIFFLQNAKLVSFLKSQSARIISRKLMSPSQSWA